MAKYRAAGKKKKGGAAQKFRAVPCLILVIGIMALLMLLFYSVLKSS